MKAADFIARGLKMIGILQAGEVAPAQDAADALVILNAMMESWGADRLTIFTLTRTLFNLTVGKQTYTCGPAGDFAFAVRPPKIEYWSPVVNTNPAQPLELDAGEPLTDVEWKDIRVKAITSPIPRAMYDDGGFPLRNLSFWPVPNDGTCQAALYTWTALSQFADLVTDYTFPPGYQEAIAYNFAMRLAAEWPGMLSPDARELARSSLARIKAMNSPIVKLKCDEGITAGSEGSYNWLTDNQ